MKRPEFSKAVRRAAFLRADGRCEGIWFEDGEPRYCFAKLTVGKVEYDHAIEAFIGGGSELDNCVVLCTVCHKRKTAARRAAIDKTRRLADKHIGIRTRPRKSWATVGGRAVRKKLSGEIVYRDTEEPV